MISHDSSLAAALRRKLYEGLKAHTANGTVKANAQNEVVAQADTAVIAALDDAIGVTETGKNTPPKRTAGLGSAMFPKA